MTYTLTGINKNRFVKVIKNEQGFYPIFIVNKDQVAHGTPSRIFKTEKGFAKRAYKFLNQ